MKPCIVCGDSRAHDHCRLCIFEIYEKTEIQMKMCWDCLKANFPLDDTKGDGNDIKQKNVAGMGQ